MKKNYLIIALLFIMSANAEAKDGLYVEFKMSSPNINGTSKTYTMEGNTRTETQMQMQTHGGSSPFTATVLMLQKNPNVVYSINETNKTYTEADARNANRSDDDEYEVTVIGKETVNNYKSTHVKALNKKTQKTTELWVSKDIINYSLFSSVKNKYVGGGKLFKALQSKGADGYIARMVVGDERGGKIQMDLVKAEKRNINESLFSLDGYTKGSAMNPAGSGLDAQRVQNMTPEERQKYIQQVREKYQQEKH